MRSRNLLLAIALGLAVVLCASAQVRAPGTARPGDPVGVAIEGLDGASQAAILRSDGSTLVAAVVFAVGVPDPSSTRGALLAVDLTALPGDYELLVFDQDGEVLHRGPLLVQPREFRSEDIALSRRLTELRTSEDPVKRTEALELQSLLAEQNPGSFFHPATFVDPVATVRRTSLFGDRRQYLYTDGGRASSIHFGVDLAAPEGSTPASFVGTPVEASGAGLVRMARARIVTGNTVVIEHLPGVFSLYYHLNDLLVEEGEMVTAGQPIGTVGATGLATGPHLHWEFRIRGVAVDPDVLTVAPLVDFDG